jgi:hypothetical protein
MTPPSGCAASLALDGSVVGDSAAAYMSTPNPSLASLRDAEPSTLSRNNVELSVYFKRATTATVADVKAFAAIDQGIVMLRTPQSSGTAAGSSPNSIHLALVPVSLANGYVKSLQ